MKKKKVLISIILLVICLLILGFIIFNIIKGVRYTEEDIVSELTTMADEVYTKLYYPEMKKINGDKSKEFLKQYEEIGLKFNLTELEKYNEKFKDKISKFKSDNKTCDKEKTMIIIYPQSPYEATNYISEVKLDCGF